MVGNSRKQIKVMLVACIGAAHVPLLGTGQLSEFAECAFQTNHRRRRSRHDHGNSYRNLPETYQKQAVFYRSQEPPGTIIVETSERHLYLIQSETGALRYGIGVGREGFTWQGLLKISRKAECAPETIGQAVSSGCFRLVNDDVVDLYERVPTGTRVVVRQH
jgi:lipoprotein-anchoring transpeptidase ErfK/SrfK